MQESLSSGVQQKERVLLTRQLQEKGEEVRHLERALSSLRTEILGKEGERGKMREVVDKSAKFKEVRVHVVVLLLEV